MEYLILFAALLLVGVFVFAKGVWDGNTRLKWQRGKIKEGFGKPAEREYEDGELYGIPRYFEKHQDGFFIDDITWNDLDMDRLFLRMNDTRSSAGQEYLYYMLRTPSFDEKELARREELIRYFILNEEKRLELQMLFLEMGRTGKYSIYDYLDFLDDLGERSNRMQILLDLCFIPAIALIAVSPPVGLMLLIILLCFNISTYLKDKKSIDPYLVSFKYVFRSLTLAEKLVKAKMPALLPEQDEIKVLLPRFVRLKKSAKWGMRSMGSGSGPLDILMDYLNMMFHFDILGFNTMLRQVRSHTAEIDELLTLSGRMEALIAAAGFRLSLTAWCEPEFVGDGIAMKELYHPFLEDPVKNDITAVRGVLLTGSNASGKSTFLKSVAVNAILAQTVHTCCADRYRGSFMRVMTSMALRDDMGSGESYYIVEIKALKRILDAVSEEGAPVLCFVDEVLRGTNTVERIAASTQILKSLYRPGVCCFAATHDIELTGLLVREYDNYHFEEEIADGDIYFPYKLMKGKATTRNAIKLLSIMGYSERIIGEAEAMAARFAANGSWEERK